MMCEKRGNLMEKSKEIYESPAIEIIALNSADIITLSLPDIEL